MPSHALWLLLPALLWALLLFSSHAGRPLLSLPKIGEESGVARYFAMCSAARRDDCVIDGDTFRLEGEPIRIADIDAPETHQARCDSEAALGARATRRLQELLNAGPFVLESIDRDEDRYGRKLRVVVRGGRSLGAMLVSEGLAREWTGRRLPWCA